MAVCVLSPKTEPDRKAVIDEFGELERRISEFGPTVKRHKILKSQIETWFEKEPADRAAALDGTLYSVQASPRGFQRKIFDQMKAFNRLRKVIGLERAIALVTIPLEAAIDAHVPEDQHAKFITKDQTGPRKLTAILKAPAAPAVAQAA